MIGQRRILRVIRFAQVQHQMSNWVGRIATVAEQLVVGAIALHDLVLLEGEEQVQKRIGWDAELMNRFA